MDIKIYTRDEQAQGAFNGGEIIENKPLGFPGEGGALKPYSNLFYWANAIAKVDSTIGLHPHKGFEILSFVLDGDIKHYDTKLNAWKDLSAGDVQIIRAGNGISHSEFMAANARMFQIWLDPNLSTSLSRDASYDDYRLNQFPKTSTEQATVTTLIGKESPLELHTEGVEVKRIKIFGSEYKINDTNNKMVGIYILNGALFINGHSIAQDDFCLISDCFDINIEGEGEIFMLSTPKELSYDSYASSLRNR